MATFGSGEFFVSTNGGAYVYRFTSVTRAKQTSSWKVCFATCSVTITTS